MLNKVKKNRFKIPDIRSNYMDCPRIEPRKRRTHTSKGKPLNKFPVKPVHIRGNSKTEPNTLDTVMGCPGKCHGCYASVSHYVYGGAMDFDSPQAMPLVPEMLKADLADLRFKHPHIDWVRLGVMGDPFGNKQGVEVTIQTAEIISDMGFKPVIITKFWSVPTQQQMIRLLLTGAIIHWSVIVGYDEYPVYDKRVAKIMDWLNQYHSYNKEENVFMRLCTFSFKPKQEGGGGLAELQEWFRQQCKPFVPDGWAILETPWKMEGNDPRWPYVNLEDYFKAKSYSDYNNPEARSRKSTCDPLYFEGDLYKSNDGDVIACHTPCTICPNQCGTIRG